MESQKSLKEDWFLWLLVLVAVILTVAYYFLGFTPQRRTESPSWLFEGVEEASIRGLTKYRGDSTVLSLERNSNNSWTLTHPEGVELDQSAVNDWVQDLLSPDLKRRFKASPGANYGINEGTTRIEIVQHGRKHTLYLGGKTPTGQGFYLRYGDAKQAPVFTLANRSRENISPGLYDLRNKQIIEHSFRSLQSVSFETEADSETYRKTSRGWTVTSADTGVLNETAAQSLRDNLRTLVNTTVSTFYDTRPPGAYRPFQGWIHLRFASGTTTVTLGGRADNERLIGVGDKPVVGVSIDPARTFKDLPAKPTGWPVVEEEPSREKPRKPATRRKLKELRKKMKKRR